MQPSDSTKLLFREILLAGGMIVVLIAALYAHTGSMPPLVVVESSSMVHDPDGEVGSIDAGDLVLVHKSSFENIVTFAEATDPSNPYYGYEAHGMEGDVVIYRKNGEASTPIIHRAILRVVPHDAYPATSTANPCPTGGTYDAEWSIDGSEGACVQTWDVPGTDVVNQSNISIQFDG
ncbi:MAG: S26 family signal peptidase, partial [Candidatus Poseidoniaceae archaeon]